MNYKASVLLAGICLFLGCQKVFSQEKIVFDYAKQCQTIHSFGASDCWRVQYLGKNWPLEKREKMADLLFSTQLDKAGNPQGIGLSMWRFNIGSGSHEAGEASGVVSPWRRTECFLDINGHWDWEKQEGQRWFIEAARKRKVSYLLGFSISAPYFMSKNGMNRATENKFANLKSDQYEAYARFMAIISKQFELDFISPINEPQWDWTGSGQEGMHATNEECFRVIQLLNDELAKQKAKTQIVFGEAGDIRYLYKEKTDKADRDNQIKEMFAPQGKYSIYGLSHVAPIVTGHSYWSTWPLDTLLATREALNKAIKNELPIGYTYWQTEYCPMEKNDDNPNGGGKRDLGIQTALYIARIIHHDLAVANAASWQSWTAFTEWNYKDGLIFVDDDVQRQGAQNGTEPMIETCKYDGTFRDSKYMWALGNYSRFIRPGMIRVDQSINSNSVVTAQTLMSSAYVDTKSHQLVAVFVNYANRDCAVELGFKDFPHKFKTGKFKMYETSEADNLTYKGVVSRNVTIPARSIVTLVTDK